MVVLVLPGFQVCQVLKETQVFLVHLADLVSQAPKEMLAFLVLLVLQVTLGLLAPQDRRCRALKDSKVPQDHLEEQVHPAQKVPVDLQEVAVLRGRRVYLVLPASLDSLDRREMLVSRDSQVPLVFLVALV